MIAPGTASTFMQTPRRRSRSPSPTWPSGTVLMDARISRTYISALTADMLERRSVRSATLPSLDMGAMLLLKRHRARNIGETSRGACGRFWR